MRNHHAFYIEGRRDQNKQFLYNFLKNELDFNRFGNPDYIERDFETMLIDDARDIRQSLLSRPFGEKKVVVISANFIGREAQNSLLKNLEEPISGIYIFLLISNENDLLPTVRSRLIKIESNLSNSKSEYEERAILFLESEASDRLKLLTEFLSHESESKKSDLILFLNEVEKKLYEKGIKTNEKNLANLLSIKKYLYDKSPSIKMIGETISLIIR